MNTHSSKSSTLQLALGIFIALLLILGVYLATFYFLPRPETGVLHPTRLSQIYYRLFYPMRKLTYYQPPATIIGSVLVVDAEERRFVLGDPETRSGIYVAIRPADEQFFRTLTLGERLSITVVDGVPAPDSNFTSSELRSYSRIK